MAKTYTTPGIYVEEISKLPPIVTPVETSIPAFIGYTEKADNLATNDLKLTPFRLSSMQEYTHYFGGPWKEEGAVIVINETRVNGITTDLRAAASISESSRSKFLMYYALQLFFANGGGPCWIVSVGNYNRRSAKHLSITALLAGLNKLKNIGEPTLLIFPEAQNLPINSFKSLHDTALFQCKMHGNRFVIMDMHGGDISLSVENPNLFTAIQNFRTNGIGSSNLKYGAAYCPNIITTIGFSYDETKVNVIHILNGVSEPAMKLNDLKAINSSSYDLAIQAISTMQWVMPPSGAIAGIYVSVDRNRGTWKSPANVSINSCIKPAVYINNEDSAEMNVDVVAGKSVNALRYLTGKGTLVWGARTLAGNDNEWRYINVSRFSMFVEESVKKATEQFVFETNDSNTWIRIQAMIENFLTNLWQQGALLGMKPEHAFFVSVGLGKTMTVSDINEGRMIIEIGLAIVRPAEFIIIRFLQKMTER